METFFTLLQVCFSGFCRELRKALEQLGSCLCNDVLKLFLKCILVFLHFLKVAGKHFFQGCHAFLEVVLKLFHALVLNGFEELQALAVFSNSSRQALVQVLDFAFLNVKQHATIFPGKVKSPNVVFN